MVQKLLSHPVFFLIVTASVVLGVFVCIFPHYFPSVSWGVNYAVQLMLLYLTGGIFFLFLKQPRLTFICFTGTAMLCFFLKYSVKSNGIERWRQTVTKRRMPEQLLPEKQNTLKIAHLNLTNVNAPAEALEAIRNSSADILSIHEVTPDWERWLDDSLSTTYPFHHCLVDIGIFGMAVFSKHELEHIDTFYYQDIPNLRGCLSLDGMAACFVSVHTEPALNSFSLRRLQEHLSSVANEVKKADMPLFVVGDFNAVSWSSEIQVFLDSTGLLESRTGFMTGGSLLDIPLDHIFFSRHLRCNDFNTLKSASNRHLGILGTYQLNQLKQNARETAQ